MIWFFFEQSGTFKAAAKVLGRDAVDVDIVPTENVDYCIDLFEEFERWTTSDFLKKVNPATDTVMAFFPCTYFEAQSFLVSRSERFRCSCRDDYAKVKHALSHMDNIYRFYKCFCLMFKWALAKNIPLIVENPWPNGGSILRLLFPIKPMVVDNDRRQHGDYYSKPTAYWFVNMPPYDNVYFDEPIAYYPYKRVDRSSGISRSLISPEYARYFLRSFVFPFEGSDDEGGF